MGFPIKTGGLKSHTIGGYTFDWDPASNPNDILLWAQAMDGTSNPYHTARRANDTSGYQVPTGRTLYVLAVDIITMAAYAAQWTFLYGNTDVGITAAAAPTSPVTYNNASSAVICEATIGKRGERGGVGFSVPTGKYLCGQSAGSATDRSMIQFYCKLV